MFVFKEVFLSLDTALSLERVILQGFGLLSFARKPFQRKCLLPLIPGGKKSLEKWEHDKSILKPKCLTELDVILLLISPLQAMLMLNHQQLITQISEDKSAFQYCHKLYCPQLALRDSEILLGDKFCMYAGEQTCPCLPKCLWHKKSITYFSAKLSWNAPQVKHKFINVKTLRRKYATNLRHRVSMCVYMHLWSSDINKIGTCTSSSL